MRFTSIVAMTCAFMAGAADAAGDQAPSALSAGHDQGAKPTSTPYNNKLISVYGFVRKQGAIQPAEGLTVSRAIEIAGGFTEFANRRKVYVTRPKDNRSFTVDVDAVLRKRPEAQDPLLQAGDQVYVPTRIRE
jgi:protein involved in polysaccharide export with SLBB domain